MTTAELTPTAVPAPEPAPKSASASPSSPLAWRWWMQLLLTLSGRLTLALLLILFATQTGLRLLCAGAETLFPVQINAAEGRLLGAWQLRELTVTLPAVTLHFGAIAVDWSPLTFISNRTLTINRLVADEVKVTLPPSSASADDAPLQLPPLRLPFQLAVTQATVNHLQIATAGATTPPFQINQLLLAATWHDTQLDLRNLTAQLSEPAFTASISGQLALMANYPLTLDLDWALTTAPAVSGHAHGNGDLRQLQLALNTSGAVTATFNGQMRELLTAPEWNGALTLAQVDMATLAPTLPPLTVEGRLATRGTMAAATLSGQLQLAQADIGAAAIALDLSWQDGVLTLHQVQMTEQQDAATTAPAPVTVQLTGQVNVSAGAPQLQLHGDWRALRWPLRTASQLLSPQGQMTVNGTLSALEYQLTATAAAADLPPAALNLHGMWREQQLTLTAFRVDALDGHFDGQATLALKSPLNWTAQLTWTDINPSVIAAKWPGRISGRLTTQGHLPAATSPDAALEITTVIEQLTGTLRGYPLAATGAVNLNGDNLHLNAVTAKVGSSSLRIDGTIAATTRSETMSSDLTLALNVPDLAQVLPDASGRVTLNGRLRGLLTAPQFKFDLNANAVRIAEQRIGRLVGSGDFDLTAPERFALQLDGKQLQLGGLEWTTLALRGDGTLPDHQLQLTANGTQTLKLAANGALSADGSSYRGAVTTASWHTPAQGQWQLQRPVHIDWAAPQLTLTPLCLQHAGGSNGCVTFAQQSAQNWSATLNVPRVETALLAALFPPTLRLQGALQFTGKAQAVNGAVTGTLAATWRTGLVHSGREHFDVSGTQLTAAVTPSELNAQLALPIKSLGTVKAEMHLPNWRMDAPLRSEQPVRGRVQAQFSELARLESLLPDLNRLRGAAMADVTVAGTLTQPTVRGEMQLKQVAFEVTALALNVTDLTLTATTPAPNQLEFNGLALLGGGQLALSGAGRWQQRTWQATLHASGQRLQVANTKEYFALVSPQVNVEFGATGATVRGEIQVPEARIRPRQLPAGTVSASPDIVLNTAPKQSPLPVTLDMRVVLGKEVTLDGFGVRGRLLGDVRVSQLPGKSLVGDGQLQIIDGQYQLSSALGLASAELGSALTIRQGRLIFAKSPLNNPGLLLQAERDGGAMSAGVRVLGTLRTPKLAFFSDSDPNMTPAQMTKYLMTGIAPADDDRAQQTGVAIGTYLAPKIYAEYEAGFGHVPDKMRLRYDVSRQIEFETETGVQQGADIYFKFEN